MRRRRSPFVVTVALAAATHACSGSTDSDQAPESGGTGAGGIAGSGAGGSGTGGFDAGQPSGGVGGSVNPPNVPCPSELPAEGSPCPQGEFWGKECSFPDPCGSATFVAQCDTVAGEWHWLGSTTCACPIVEPIKGNACDVDVVMCIYPETCCGIYNCYEGQWITGVCRPQLSCPATPPVEGSPCDPCVSCTWGFCVYGVVQQGICRNRQWHVTEVSCEEPDAGAP